MRKESVARVLEVQCIYYFSRVFNSSSTGIQARPLKYFRFSDLQKYFLIMLNKSFLFSDYDHESLIG